MHPAGELCAKNNYNGGQAYEAELRPVRLARLFVFAKPILLPTNLMKKKVQNWRDKFYSPLVLPVYYFAGIIAIGTVLLQSPLCEGAIEISWLDALFTSTSATCVTGLIVVDTPTSFSIYGHIVILILIQLGGLGIMTFTSLIFILWRKQISLTDRIAVGDSLMNDRSFNFVRFLLIIVAGTLTFEAIGAVLLYVFTGGEIGPWSAVFHAVSAFCNAGFSLFSNSLENYRGHVGVNMVVMLLIFIGGLGFSVLIEVGRFIKRAYQQKTIFGLKHRWSWQASTVLQTSFLLVLFGWVAMWFSELSNGMGGISVWERSLLSLFQSVSGRTAGFNTIDVEQMTNVSLLILIFLMFVGGSPGSCAGGIKTTTFRILVAFIISRLRGRQQTVFHGYAINSEDLNKALTLVFFGVFTVLTATIFLSITEQANQPHELMRGKFLDILFEVVSAFGTVGLSTGVTETLSTMGKCIIIFLMFLGRLGPILFLSILIEWQTKPRFLYPENRLMVG